MGLHSFNVAETHWHIRTAVDTGRKEIHAVEAETCNLEFSVALNGGVGKKAPIRHTLHHGHRCNRRAYSQNSLDTLLDKRFRVLGRGPFPPNELACAGPDPNATQEPAINILPGFPSLV